MNFKKHIIFSTFIIILLKIFNSDIILIYSNYIIITTIIFLTCLLPDIDHPKSLLGKKIKWLSNLIYKIFGHRELTHSLLAIILYIYLINFIFQILFNIKFSIYLIQSIIIGYISHIIADILTPHGIPLLWPFNCRFSLFPINIITEIKFKKLFYFIFLIFIFFT